jgi:hypothetical protein
MVPVDQPLSLKVRARAPSRWAALQYVRPYGGTLTAALFGIVRYLILAALVGQDPGDDFLQPGASRHTPSTHDGRIAPTYCGRPATGGLLAGRATG